MVSLLLELGAEPLAVDGSGQPAVLYATSRDVDTSLMQAIRTMTASEMVSAERGHRPPRIGMLDLAAVLSLRDTATADRLLRESPAGIQPGTLHLMAKRNDVDAVMWLLAHGADPNAKWAHRDSEVTPLHLAASQGHAEVVRLLLAAGADPGIRDSKHDSDVRGWAEFFKKPEIVEILEGQART